MSALRQLHFTDALEYVLRKLNQLFAISAPQTAQRVQDSPQIWLTTQGLWIDLSSQNGFTRMPEKNKGG